ncbi:hypothetical protein LR48_Vigan09g178200 [Vigna angularis]|uniref:Wall-associated receptor kinase C-terminal domain-containing protein n=1 Tax=Phaseolus angularis TaxID=3914 RepID=A0A0L9VDN7_PHAAN|nr:hypothetical protein LR48_Vigan09g178200 [Vigna angularis]
MKPKLTLHPSFIFVLLLISTIAPTYLCENDARYTNCSNAFTYSFDNAHFQYDHQYNDLGNVTLFYDCPSNSPPSLPQTDLLTQSCGADKNVYYTPLPVPSYTGSCTVVVIPIFETNASLVLEKKIIDALQNGFELNWEGDNGECEKCSNSGGECGVDEGDGGFQCFCVDEPHSATCKAFGMSIGVD